MILGKKNTKQKKKSDVKSHIKLKVKAIATMRTTLLQDCKPKCKNKQIKIITFLRWQMPPIFVIHTLS